MLYAAASGPLPFWGDAMSSIFIQSDDADSLFEGDQIECILFAKVI